MAENSVSDPAKDMSEASFIRLAEAHRREGLTDDAIRICREGLVKFPSSLRGRIVLGQSLLDHGAIGEAIVELGRVEREAGGDPEIIALLCEVRMAAPRARPVEHATAPVELASSVARDEETGRQAGPEPSVFTLDGEESTAEAPLPGAPQDDPLASATLAGLYASQGDPATASAILRRVAAAEAPPAPTVEESLPAESFSAGYLGQLARLRQIAERLRKVR